MRMERIKGRLDHIYRFKKDRFLEQGYIKKAVAIFDQVMEIIDQRPSKISDNAMAKINTKICMSLNAHKVDVQAMSPSRLFGRYR